MHEGRLRGAFGVCGRPRGGQDSGRSVRSSSPHATTAMVQCSLRARPMEGAMKHRISYPLMPPAQMLTAPVEMPRRVWMFPTSRSRI